MEWIQATYESFENLNKLKNKTCRTVNRIMGDCDSSSTASDCDAISGDSSENDNLDDDRLINNLNINESTANISYRFKDVARHQNSKMSDGKGIKRNNAASPRDNFNSYYCDTLTIDIVEKLEDDLEFYEKVSIVFLAFEDSQLEYALQCLTIACKDNRPTNKLITDWCRTDPKYWREKLLQAFVIINNFYVLRKLGFKDNNAKHLFSPSNRNRNYVSPVRKSIYNFCESLSVNDSVCIINKVNNDLKVKGLINGVSDILVSDPRYMELSFLFWLSKKYIFFYVKNVNLDNIIQCLSEIKESSISRNVRMQFELIQKKFDEQQKKKFAKRNRNSSRYSSAINDNSKKLSEIKIENNLKQVLPNQNERKNRSKTKRKLAFINNMLVKPQESGTDANSRSSASSSAINSKYRISDYYGIINPTEIGLCIIINQKNFKFRDTRSEYLVSLSREILPDRDGTEIDVNTINDTFKKLLYKVIKFDDLKHCEMLNCITTTVQENFIPNVHSSIFLFVLTHGFEGHVYGCNSVPVSVNDIKKRLMQCKNVTGKPKAIIIQACQGNVPQEVVVPDGAVSGKVQSAGLHGECDLFVGFATVPGYVAFRHKKNGTWFIQTLCQCIYQHADSMDFVKIFTRVNDKISQKRAADESGHTVGQISEYRSSLRTEWYLVPPKSDFS